MAEGCGSGRRVGRRPLTLVAVAALATGMAGPALALDPTLPKQDFGVTGDWGGARTRLKDAGWTLQAGETVEGAGNVRGGSRHMAVGASQFSVGVTGDLGKLAGLPHAWLQATITHRDGNTLGPKAGLDPAMQFIEVFGRGNRWRLTQFFYEQQFAAERVDLKLGRVNPGADFDAFACDFENLTFCGAPPGNLLDYWYNAPVGQWGARLRVAVGPSGYVEAGAYQVNPRNLHHGFDLSFGGADGGLYPFEAGWAPKLGAAHLPGAWRIGGWYSDVRGSDVLLDAGGLPTRVTGDAPRRRNGRYGGYLSIEQQVSGTAKGPGLSLFLNATQADRRTTEKDRQIALGATYAGLISARPKDELALAVGWTHYNGRLADNEALGLAAGTSDQPVQGTETVGELDYRFALAQGLTVTPNVQWVHRVGGVHGRDATVLGVKAVLGL
jgi:porin